MDYVFILIFIILVSIVGVVIKELYYIYTVCICIYCICILIHRIFSYKCCDNDMVAFLISSYCIIVTQMCYYSRSILYYSSFLA